MSATAAGSSMAAGAHGLTAAGSTEAGAGGTAATPTSIRAVAVATVAVATVAAATDSRSPNSAGPPPASDGSGSRQRQHPAIPDGCSVARSILSTRPAAYLLHRIRPPMSLHVRWRLSPPRALLP